MDRTRAPKNRSQLVSLYERWIDAQEFHFARVFALLSLVTTLVLAAFDHIIFGDDAAFFYPYRLAGLLLTAGILAFLQVRRAALEGRSSTLVKALMAAPALFYNGISHSFLVTAHFQKDIIYQGNVFSLALTVFYFYRFCGIQYFLQAASVGSLTAIALLHEESRPQAATLLLANGLIFMANLFLRRQFVQSIFDRFQALASMLPTKLAEFIALSNRAEDMDKVFAPRRMHTICVVSDWRNYQNLISEREPEDISRLFEVFYESVLEELERKAPSGHYYASWTADELFVVFYAEEDRIEENFAEAAAFVMSFATGLSDKLRRALGFDLLYDIGISAGPGLLGLQGPHRMKKTTVVSRVAGQAKRLETEAKMFRHGSVTRNHYPVIAMDTTFGSYLLMKDHVRVSDIHEVKATTKDISDSVVYVWQHAHAATRTQNGRDVETFRGVERIVA